MCTAVTYRTKDHYFGRNLDYNISYGEMVAVTPRQYPFSFRRVPDLKEHYAMIGMAVVSDGYPLYYEASNEKGLSMAGLLFAGNAVYQKEIPGKDNIAPFEFIPWLLGQCACLSEVREKLENLNLVDLNFNEAYPLSPLHWMISDRDESIVVEAVKEGMKVYDNPTGVLTNNPPFHIQLFQLNRYLGLSCGQPENTFSKELDLKPASHGLGAWGLPGDLSSESRFVKAAFTRMNAVSGESESESVSQFFHILGSVSQQRGCVDTGHGNYETTIYSCCCNTDRGIYYYRTYENSQITAVDMRRENLDGSDVVSYPLILGQQFRQQN